MIESSVQQRIRLDAAQQGIWLMRNNSGACYDDTGRLIRYGLGNDSPQINKRIKSSDLIGIRPILITSEMVGQVVGVFIAVEVKGEEWNGTVTGERLTAQQKFHTETTMRGGYAGFASNLEQFRRIARL